MFQGTDTCCQKLSQFLLPTSHCDGVYIYNFNINSLNTSLNINITALKMAVIYIRKDIFEIMLLINYSKLVATISNLCLEV